MKNQNILGKTKLSKLDEIDLSKIEEIRLSNKIKDFLNGVKKEFQLINTMNVDNPIDFEISYMIIFRKEQLEGAFTEKDLFNIKFVFTATESDNNISPNNIINFETSMRSFIVLSVENLLINFAKTLDYEGTSLIEYPMKEVYKFAKKIDELFNLKYTIKNIIDCLKLERQNNIFIVEDVYRINIRFNQLSFTNNGSEKKLFELKLFKEFDSIKKIYKGKIKLLVNNSLIEFDDEKFYNLEPQDLFNILKLLHSVEDKYDYYENIYSIEDLYKKLKIENVVEY